MSTEEAREMIQRYREAEMAVLEGKSVTFNGQQLTLESLSQIRAGRQVWERRLAAMVSRRRGKPGFKLARF
ncbi:hypothetical protein [Escherichia coli]|uniref:hypothetical protein n=1 Tax=Escherichia coli TaxID=562 RepID=UPI0003EF57A9|nr:hypothetical protein [Escherichia coli]EFA7397126.1 hypothetical protein [Escherichia coli]EFB9221248.1 hypothetical protein [Escherichia coli]EFG6483915.1 hypothetical protein [Escherichia coli]EFH5794790.1 hypothetical protein [Escherichia coli]EFH6427821.1 hypothetical protein [Escherichia coli]